MHERDYVCVSVQLKSVQRGSKFGKRVCKRQEIICACLSQISMTCMHICFIVVCGTICAVCFQVPQRFLLVHSCCCCCRSCRRSIEISWSFPISFIAFFLARNRIVSHVVGVREQTSQRKNTNQIETPAIECTNSNDYYLQSKHTTHILLFYRSTSSKVNCLCVECIHTVGNGQYLLGMYVVHVVKRKSTYH